jgi:hypothetical protein
MHKKTGCEQVKTGKAITILCSAILLIIASIDIVGWITNSQALIQWLPDSPSMKFSTSIMLIMISISLLAINKYPRITKVSSIILILSCFISIIAKVFFDLNSSGTSQEQLIHAGLLSNILYLYQSYIASLSMIIIGFVMLAIKRKMSKSYSTNLIRACVFITLIGLVQLFSHFIDIPSIELPKIFNMMAASTAIAVTTIGISLLYLILLWNDGTEKKNLHFPPVSA